MKKVKLAIICVIIGYLVCSYRQDIISFINTLPFIQINYEYDDTETDKRGYEYYFKPYTQEK
ncbi:MAG TPA: hypothetical protein DCG30_02270 [Ruminococcus sp.]|nr:hypothetical protein [Ruminococcus sp.]